MNSAAVRAITAFASGGCERSATATSRATTPVAAAASRVPAATARDVLDQLVGDPVERLCVLHDRDGQIEGGQQLGLVGAFVGRAQAGSHRGQVHADTEATLPREFERGPWTERAIKVQVQLRLGHARDQVARPGLRGQVMTTHNPIVRQRTALAAT
jgi:hypothetical protein